MSYVVTIAFVWASFSLYAFAKSFNRSGIHLFWIVPLCLLYAFFGLFSLAGLSMALEEKSDVGLLVLPFAICSIYIVNKWYKNRCNRIISSEDIIGNDPDPIQEATSSHVNQSSTNKMVTFEYPDFRADDDYLDGVETFTTRSVFVRKEYGEYFSGYCTLRNANRTFRKDRVLRYLNGTELHLITTDYLNNDHNPNNKLEVTFIGFKKAEKEALVKLAKKNKLYVATVITKRLFALVIGGGRDAPTKRAQAEEQGAYIMDETQFRHFIETGEITV